MRIVLHHAHEARSMRVLWLLEELGAAYELVLHDFFDKSLRSEDYLAINPAARVPALEIDGQVICESGAAIEYLCEQFPEKKLGRLPGHVERGEWLDMLHYAESIGQHLAALTQAHIVLYEDWMRSPTQMSLEAKRLEKVLGRLEARLSDGRDYVLRRGFSGVDCAIGYSVDVARRFVRLEKLPHVAAYHARVTAREAFKAACLPENAKRIYEKDFYEVPDV